jgi:hypothetical protein
MYYKRKHKPDKQAQIAIGAGACQATQKGDTS